uniref:pectinesterase n=1 Tax=Oryza brachyantha TaxID=4533 RepID=J3M1V5_ORYBR
MPNKAAVGSVVAAVGVVAVVCAIAAVTSSKKGGDHAALSANVRLSTVCSVTRYPGRCEQSLGPVVNDTADPESVLRAALQVALDEVASAFNRSEQVAKDDDGKITKSAIQMCKKLLNDSSEDLRGMAGLNPEQVTEHINDLRTWLSGVMTYIYTCADGFDKPELKEAMDKVLQNSTELSSNALAIITRLGDLMPEHPSKSNGSAGAHRRLLGLQGGEIAVEGESLRRLLAVHDKVQELADVKDVSRKLLSETLDEITALSHDASRRLLGLTSETPGGEHRQLKMSYSVLDGTTNAISEEHAAGEHPQPKMYYTILDGPTNAIPEDPTAAGEHRQLSMMFNAISNMTRNADNVKRRLLSIPSNDGSEATGHDGGSRALLSAQLENLANMSDDMNRYLLAVEIPDDLAGRRTLLSSTLRALNEVTTEAKGQLDSIENGTLPSDAIPERTLSEEFEEYKATPHHRLLTTNVVGTIDDIEQERHQRPKAGEFPEWVPAHQRRLLQLTGMQKPNTVVAKDGSGDFKTITEAINAAPKKSATRFVIYVKAGEYNEYVTVTSDLPNIFMYGDGPTRTRVIGNKSNKDGVATMASRTFSAEGSGFVCKSMGFVNTAGPEGHQAVALHVQGDMSVFFNCKFEGYQDTLYVHANRQFFRNCEVSGTIDFIFGNSAAVFQNCLMTVRKPMDNQMNMVTAQGRTDPNMPTGIVLQGCRIVPEQALFPVRLQIASYLGRPWKEYSRTVIMESVIGDLIKPEGWSEWMGDQGLKTLYYAEYANTGPGAGTSKRVAWPGYRVIGQAEATQFTAGVFIDGLTWLKNTATPNVMGFIK